MTVQEMQDLLHGLPPDMDVVMETEQDVFTTVCKMKSKVIEMTLLDEETEDENEEPEMITEHLLVLIPCDCYTECDIEIGDINSQPELN